MATLTSPSEIARETLKTLAARKLAPTPDNYAQAYQEISGATQATTSAAAVQPNAQSVAAESPGTSPEITWSSMIRDLLRQLDMPHKGITTTRKKEGIETVLSRFSSDPAVLHEK